MGPANTWFSVAFQLSIGIGVAVGAVALRLASLTAGVEQPGLTQFHVALAAIALFMASSAFAALGLARDAGAAITARA